MCYPECVARVPFSLWRFGAGAVFAKRCATNRNRWNCPQPFTAVRNRSQPFATVRARSAVPLASYKMVTFGNFRCCVASFRVAGVASHMFHNGPNVSKVVLCDRRHTVASFSKDELHVLDSATLWRPASSFCVAGAALQTCRVAVFLCESHCQGFPATKYADHLLKSSQGICHANDFRHHCRHVRVHAIPH